MKERPGLIRILLWLASVFAMIGIMILGGRFFEESNVELLIEFALITIVTLTFLYLISGKKTFARMGSQTGYAIRELRLTLLFPFVFFLFGVLSYFMEKPPLSPTWAKDLGLAIVNMFLVGMYEEGCFRACACDALLPAFRKLKHPFFLTALISAFVFGYVHVSGTELGDLQLLLQFILKIVTVGINGIIYLIVYWKTRDLLGIAIVHGLYDLLPDLLYTLFVWKDETDTGYVSGDSGTTIVYLIQLAFELLCLFIVIRRVGKTIDYRKTLEEW